MRGIQDRRTPILAVVLLLIVGSTRAGAQRPSECFSLSYGTWTNLDPRWGPPEVPAMVRLEGFARGESHGMPAGFSADTGWIRVAKSYRPRFTSWRALDPRSVLVTFGTGGGRLELRFAERGGMWSGTGQAISDEVGRPRPTVELVATPSPCP